MISVNVINLGDLLILSRFAPAGDVALYRVGSRIGSVTSYWSSAFGMAWGPLRRDLLYQAAETETDTALHARTVTYYVITTAWLLLAVVLLADALVGLAASAYGGAADLVCLLAASFALHGLYVQLYRAQRFRLRRRWFISITAPAAAAFIVAALLLAPSLEGTGVALASCLAWLGAGLAIWTRGFVSDRRVPLEYRRLLAAVGLALVLGAGVRALSPGRAAVELLIEVGAIVLYPFGLMLLDPVPREALAVLRGRNRGRPRPAEEMSDRRFTHALLVDERAVSDLAASSRMDEADVHRRFVRGLRAWGEIGDEGPYDDRSAPGCSGVPPSRSRRGQRGTSWLTAYPHASSSASRLQCLAWRRLYAAPPDGTQTSEGLYTIRWCVRRIGTRASSG